MTEARSILSVGHSNGDLGSFLDLLSGAGVGALIDVRSAPVSQFAPHFSRAPLEKALRASDIGYAFAGKALGGRPQGSEYYSPDGHVLYYRMAVASWFLQGIGRLEEMADEQSVCIMCSEENPTGCHRHLLIARVLSERGSSVIHLRHDGTVRPYESMSDVRRHAEPTLFDGGEDHSWISIRSVLRSDRRPSSSTH